MKQYKVGDLVKLSELSKKIVMKYDKATVVRVFDSMTSWLQCGCGVNVDCLEKILFMFSGDKKPAPAEYDEVVKRELMHLYTTAVDKGMPTVYLLEAGIMAQRYFNTLLILADTSVTIHDAIASPYQYASNKDWSDEWIIDIVKNQDKLSAAYENGYNIMEAMTPSHSELTFYEVCNKLGRVSGEHISLEWLKNPNWSNRSASIMIDLMTSCTVMEWDKRLFPWMSCFIFEDVYHNSLINGTDYERSVSKWLNVTPKLEVQIGRNTSGMSIDERFQWYQNSRVDYKCDGDELADCISTTFAYDDFVLRRSDYYHEQVREYVNNWVKDPSKEWAGPVGELISKPIFDAAKLMGGG